MFLDSRMKLDTKKTQAVLLDIEGTVGSIYFVHQVLFPLAQKAMDSFLQKHFASLPEYPSLAQEYACAHNISTSQVTPLQVSSLLRVWMSEDRKETRLKAIQGKIWQKAFEQKEIMAHLYPDVMPFLQSCQKADLPVAIFSSGSVTAQKLYFRYNEKGDLSSYLSAYFDTQSGSKKESQTYIKIARDLRVPPASVIFFSDNWQELEAAALADTQAVCVQRENENNRQESQDPSFTTISSFAQITFV